MARLPASTGGANPVLVLAQESSQPPHRLLSDVARECRPVRRRRGRVKQGQLGDPRPDGCWSHQHLLGHDRPGAERRADRPDPRAVGVTARPCRSRSASQLTKGIDPRRIPWQPAASNIHCGTSTDRGAWPSSSLHWNTAQPPRTTTRSIPTARPYHGCHGYRTSRDSIRWVSDFRLVQCVASPSGVGPTGAVRIGSVGPVQPTGRIIGRPVLGGLHHVYHHAA
jgi:hypothetical protein